MGRALAAAAALPIACTPTTLLQPAAVGTGDHAADTAPQDTAAGDDPIPGDSSDTAGDDTAGEDTDDDPETWPKGCPDFYDPDEVQEFDLDFRGREWQNLQDNCNQGSQDYEDVTLTWKGESIDAKVRLKGNWSWNCGKLQFVVSFNEDDPDQRFHGQRKLVFDAPWYDRTLLHERLAHPVFERLGLPYSCVNNARVNVNGEYYGLYANIERMDHEYLERHFEDPTGNLYQAASELKTNEDVGDTSDLQAYWAADTVEELEAVIDLDEATAEWAAEAMIPAMDNYWAGVDINYYVYDAPGRGFLFLPYDLDLSFGDGAYGDGSLVWPNTLTSDPITWEHPGWRKEALFMTVLSHRGWCETFVEKLELARAAADPDLMAAQLDAWSEQIEDDYEDDPRKVTSSSEHARSVGMLRQFLYDRADFVDAWLAEGGHCPAQW